MNDSLAIDQVARMTGLTSRALRFYEARGLVKPFRSSAGRRVFSRDDLERLQRIVALKNAGFSLAEIARLLDRPDASLRRTLETHLAALEAERARIDTAAEAIRRALSRIEAGERLDAATLCSLIEQGNEIMTEKAQWDALSDRYLSDEAKADFAKAPYPAGAQGADYGAKWAALGAKIQAALPLDPASAEAQGYLAEWLELLAPFKAVATPAMMRDVSKMYGDMGGWGEGAPSPGFGPEVWQFIQAAGQCAKGA